MDVQAMIWIGYTTQYRGGGAQMRRAAQTLAANKAGDGVDVRCVCIERKHEFVAAMRALHAAGECITELHLITHSGMYGPMFGTTDWPEQLSPHEWRSIRIPFASAGQAWFHACRSARWFAPFFARTFGVVAHGYHGYTSFSTHPDRFQWEGPRRRPGQPMYVMGAPGRTSHGLLGSVLKYGLGRREDWKTFSPTDADQSYDAVAELYDAVFDDIRIRSDEWQWLSPRIPPGVNVLDLGCGNGALLAQLSPRIAKGVGVDASAGQLRQAQKRCETMSNVSFHHINGPEIPVDDHSMDVAVSLLSWRYLDWDPLLQELARVLRPDGRLLIVDMAAKPITATHVPRMLRDRIRGMYTRRSHATARQALRTMVQDARWQNMLQYNPIRAEHEYRWYLESRFPGRTVTCINVGWRARVLAFDSGPFAAAQLHEMHYP